MRVQIINEAMSGDPKTSGKPELCFQWCRYVYDNGGIEHGYRFIWRMADSGHLQPARGQAKLPSVEKINWLMEKAKSQGWGHYDADKIDAQFA